MKNCFVLIFILMFFVETLNAQVFVKHDATGANNGTSWANAYTDLQMAIDSTSGQDIWVAAGTYYPQSDTSGNYFPLDFREKSFHLRLSGGGNLKLYGGFIGNESHLTQRNPNTYITTLSGDLGVVNSNEDNAYHIITIHNDSGISKIIDGFEISKGNADGLGINQDRGGAIYMTNTNVKINSCKIQDNNSSNKGGAIYLEYSFVYINSAKCYNNYSDSGGAIYSSYSSTNSTLSEFYNNQANVKGGAIFMENDLIINLDIYSSIIVQNSFDGNLALNSGGAIFIKDKNASTHWNSNVFKNNLCDQGSFFTLINSKLLNFYLNTVVDNGLISSVAFYAQNSSGNIGRSIFWNKGNNEFELIGSPNLKVDNSLLKGNIVPETNGTKLLKNIDPKFVNYPLDLHLKITSPAINVGGTFFTNFLSNDFDNTIRKKGIFYDIGAYEFDPINCPNTTRVYVDSSASSFGDGANWGTAYNDLDDGLYMANSCPNVVEVWISKGVYKPTASLSRDYTFKVNKSLGIYGGFHGFETLLNQRILSSQFSTIISGEIGMINDVTDNIKNLFIFDELTMNIVMDGIYFESCYNNSGKGGAIYINQQKHQFNNCIFRNNLARDGGGVNVNFGSKAQFYKCTFSNNHAEHFGGGLYYYTDSLVLLETVFNNNTALLLGGAIYSTSSYGLIDSMLLFSNIANQGGGLHINNGNTNISRLHSTNNVADRGGSILVSYNPLTINNSTFFGDSAEIGAAINIRNSNVELVNVDAKLNRAILGAFYSISNSTCNIKNCNITNNKSQGLSGYGSLLDGLNSKFSIEDSNIEENTNLTILSMQGCTIDIINSSIFNNSGLNNGGRMFDLIFPGKLNIRSMESKGNKFDYLIFCSGSTSTDSVNIVGGIFEDNEASGIWLSNIEHFLLENSVFANNLILDSSKTLFSLSSNSNLKVKNSVAFGNQFQEGPTSNLISVNQSQLHISNSIIYSNSKKNISNTNSIFNFYNSIIEAGVSHGNNIIDVSPLFVNPTFGDFNLQMGSPAINTGSPLNAPATDILGNPRPLGGFYDMGIYEYAIPSDFIFNGAFDNDWHKGGNWDTGFPPPNVFNGNISFNASATKIDGLGFDIKNPGTMTLGNGVVVEIK